MNPVLLKPGSDSRSQVVCGVSRWPRPAPLTTRSSSTPLEETVAASLADLRRRFDVVICEGAGSPAEINLRRARRREHRPGARRPASRRRRRHRPGGLFAAMYGTLAVLRRRTSDASPDSSSTSSAATCGCSSPASDMLTVDDRRPTLGVIPWSGPMARRTEDSLDLDSRPLAGEPTAGTGQPAGRGHLAEPCLSEHHRYGCAGGGVEPQVPVVLASSAEQIAHADRGASARHPSDRLRTLPGTGERQFAEAIVARAPRG